MQNNEMALRNNTALGVLHLYAAFLSGGGLAMLLIHAAVHAYPPVNIAAYSIYGGLTAIYFIFSATYHLMIRRGRSHPALNRIDGCLLALLRISPLLPIQLITLAGAGGWVLFGLTMLYLLLAAGEVLSAWVRRVFGRVALLLLAVILVSTTIALTHQLTGVAMFWFYAGMVSYLIAGAASAGLIPFRFYDFGNHELAHVLTVLGAVFHYVLIYNYIL